VFLVFVGLRRGSVRVGRACGGASGTLPPYLVMPAWALRRADYQVWRWLVHGLNRYGRIRPLTGAWVKVVVALSATPPAVGPGQESECKSSILGWCGSRDHATSAPHAMPQLAPTLRVGVWTRRSASRSGGAVPRRGTDRRGWAATWRQGRGASRRHSLAERGSELWFHVCSKGRLPAPRGCRSVRFLRHHTGHHLRG
jgi:hypothetical protein